MCLYSESVSHSHSLVCAVCDSDDPVTDSDVLRQCLALTEVVHQSFTGFGLRCTCSYIHNKLTKIIFT